MKLNDSDRYLLDIIFISVTSGCCLNWGTLEQSLICLEYKIKGKSLGEEVAVSCGFESRDTVMWELALVTFCIL